MNRQLLDLAQAVTDALQAAEREGLSGRVAALETAEAASIRMTRAIHETMLDLSPPMLIAPPEPEKQPEPEEKPKRKRSK